MIRKQPLIYVALPVMDEMDHLPNAIKAILEQTYRHFHVVVCVNQPDSWWSDEKHLPICIANREALSFLASINDDRIEIMDYSSPGKGWPPKADGIGFARKLMMDHICLTADADDIVISLDADVIFDYGYFTSIVENLSINKSALAISVPYYHGLVDDESINRAILRYEIYMRSYSVNMWRIKSPYCFTALGSAIAFPVRTYKKVGGITPKMSGEDFYFLQKIVKNGPLLHWNAENVYPAARLSSRVNFGTGPALIKGISGDWSSYPVYSCRLFDRVAETYKAFHILFRKNIETLFDDFLINKFGELPWDKLRQNFKTEEHFVRACHEKIDGLRILQFLKELQLPDEEKSAANTIQLVNMYKTQYTDWIEPLNKDLDFSDSPISVLDDYRNVLYHIETDYRRRHWRDFAGLTSLFN